MDDKRFGFIGLGLIGGSIAKCLKKAIPDCTITAYMRTRAKLEYARSEGIVDVIADGVDQSFSSCDVIFLCTPVEYNEMYLTQLKDIVGPHTLLTDVGSTKTSIHKLVSGLQMDACFIGGHPMAGSEKTGYESSDVLLLENAYYMVTPTSNTDPANLDRLTGLIKLMNAIPFVIDYHKHDEVVATISHLPHLIAASLVDLVRSSDDKEAVMKRVAAGGFKDITRIASSSPVMWEQICETNQAAILSVLDRYISGLKTIRDELDAHNMAAIHDLFERAGSYRNSIADESKGLIDAQYSFSVHVSDRPGAISVISAVLAAYGISIKNIGINHNRESGEGALLISFYDSDSCDLAKKQLKLYNYKVE